MRRAWGSAMKVTLVLLTAPLAALAQQGPTQPGSNFNRLNTVRREVMVSPAQAGQGQETTAPATSSSWGSSSQLRRVPQPLSVQTRTTPHTFYPGMRAAQGPNRNVAPRYSQSRAPAPLLVPGMLNPGAGMMGSIPASSRSQKGSTSTSSRSQR